MNVAQMRRADRWLGAPVCFLLGLWRRSLAAHDRRRWPSRLLFIKLAEQGSTVLARAALDAAAMRVGRKNVYFLLFEENRAILDILDWSRTRTSSPSRPAGYSAPSAARSRRSLGKSAGPASTRPWTWSSSPVPPRRWPT